MVAHDDAALARLVSDDTAVLREVLTELEAGGSTLPAAGLDRVLELLAHPGKEIRRRAAGALSSAVAAGVIATERVEAALGDGDAARRFGAAFALARAGHASARVVEAALDALGDADGDVRWAAAGIVCAAAAADDALRTRIGELTADARIERRKMALYCLRDLGVTDPAMFLHALDDVDPNVRMAGIAGIGRAGPAASEIVARLIAIGRGDAVAGVRRAAVGVLGMVGLADEQARAALAGFAADPDPHAARAARAALARVRSEPESSQ